VPVIVAPFALVLDRVLWWLVAGLGLAWAGCLLARPALTNYVVIVSSVTKKNETYFSLE
jgi:hypothetical protein